MQQDRNSSKPSSSKGADPSAQERGSKPGAPRLPSISLPKGGGAIRGIGEKFSVNSATGTASFSVPLKCSPGRAGFGPQLTLAYDSGSGNGPFGLGWSLSLPSITRKTDKGLPRYLDHVESDSFILVGAEDLVPILNAANERVTIPRRLHSVDYTVHLYRPRTEGLFARVERWTRVDNGVSHWRTITRDNVTTIFGSDENSRIVDPHDERRVYSYLIRFTFDDKGNAVQYEYVADDLAGINRTAAHEANRTDDDRRTQRYLKYVRYGNVLPYFPDWSETGVAAALPANWHFQMVFDYGDHRADAPTPVRDPALDPPWPLRPDPFSVYRAGFEVRTYRRCERVLGFHQFAGQPGFNDPTLVRSTDFEYSDETAPTDPRNPVYTFIERMLETGYKRRPGGYDRRSTPPLEFFYSQPAVHPEILTLTDVDSRDNLPEGLDGSRFQWVDLDGEGLSGILSEERGGWGYKRNLSPINQVTLPGGRQVARAHFAPSERIASLPVPSSLGGSQQLLDLTGEGRPDLVMFDGPIVGYYARTADATWEPLQTFDFVPRLNWAEPNLKFVDLTGDGQADVLITEDDLYTFHQSLGVDGFREAEHIPAPWDEERGPRVVFADGTQTISLTDLSGDGLSDVIRVRNGEVCYWPNLGYGRFGAKVTMDNAPRFADEQGFDPRRIRFADVDGSGTTDLLYIGHDGVQVCFNRSGNSWATPQLLAIFPAADSLSSVQALDLLGNGTTCLVWSSPLPAHSHASLRYVDLMGSEKPHLMVRTRNNLGAETRVAYAPSTRFYLQDKRSGKPWITRLPFPVQVVERTEIYDWIGRSRFVTRYAYHHGYFDGEEREFRGFGMVEQWDTAVHRDDTLFPEVQPANEDADSFSPPMLTRTWYHTGAFIEAGNVSQQYAREYWVEPALRANTSAAIAAREAMLLPDTVLDPGIDTAELREAYRALKGTTLRVEIYALDNTPRAEHPYMVTEQNMTVRRVQRRGPNRHAVFMTHPRESLGHYYERQSGDPRLTHELTLEVDPFGNPLRSVSVAYGRRPGYDEPEPTLSLMFRTMLAHDQTRLHVRAVENAFTLPVNTPTAATNFDVYRAPLPSETFTSELTGLALSAGAIRFSFAEMVGHWTTLWTGAHDVPYEDVSGPDIDGTGTPAAFGRRTVERTRTLYRSDNLTSLLALGTAGANALPGETYQLALTPNLIDLIFDTRVTDAILAEGGYVRPPGESDWWIPSGRIFYSANDADPPATELNEARAHFYQTRRLVDPSGAVSRIDYDAFDLLPTVATDAVLNVTSCDNDYRVLRPFRTTDPNGNGGEVVYDCLGAIAGLAVNGKAGEGDSFAVFNPDLTNVEIETVMNDPLANPAALLGTATSRIVNDTLAYFRTRDLPTPSAPAVYTLTRHTHVSDLAAGQTTDLKHVIVYSDGFGREAQQKAQAEAGPVDGVGLNVSPRWVGSGWTIYNNKVKPVRKYEPFFSATHAFEFNRLAGVSSVLFYDPLERVVATFHPDNAFEKTVFEAWRRTIWDNNDTVLIADPRTDPDVGSFFQRLLDAAPYVSWHDRRIGGTFGGNAEERTANQTAAVKAATHDSTPNVVHFDSLGRNCLNVANNGIVNGLPERFAIRTAFDTEGKPLAVINPNGQRAVEFCVREPLPVSGFRYVAGYDIAGNALYHNSMDAGERRTLNNIDGDPLRDWDARGFTSRTRYDDLRRLTHRFIGRTGFSEILVERRVYGERHPDASLNLRGKEFRHYDSGGVAINDRYDFKGNRLQSSRQFARLTPATTPSAFYDTTPDWTALNTITESPALDVAALDAAAAAELNADDLFTASSRFDALNRAIQTVTPHRTTAPSNRPSVIQPIYNEANLLERIDVWIRQAASPSTLLDPATADQHVITAVEYNSHGQRLSITQGNGVVTTSTYEPETFRLKTLTTTRPAFAADQQTVQALTYTYDATGNITRIHDAADIQNVVFFNNQRVEPSADYTYDSVYRLTSATGREHLGQTGGNLHPPQQIANDDSFRTNHLAPGDGTAVGTYTENYEYDAVGNILRMIHQVASGGWTRRYLYAEPSRITPTETSNRLSANSLAGDNPLGPYSARYEYDEHGNMTRMPHLPRMTWDAEEHLQSTTRQSVNSGMPETTYYSYDADGQRIRKITYTQAGVGQTPLRRTECLYFGTFEITREFDVAGNLSVERETLHVMLDQRPVCVVQTRTLGTDPGPPQLFRYQYSNHLGSALLELAVNGDVISYEEFFPFGSSSYRAVRNLTETPKRYRYTGKERDEENDLYYHGARYYAPWLGRWTACDPVGTADHINLYVYVRNNPIVANDPTGLLTWRQIGIIAAVVVVAVAVTVVTAGAGAALVGAAASAVGGTALGATGAAAVTFAGTVAVGTAAGAASGIAADATAQLLTRQPGERWDWNRTRSSAAGGAAAGGALSIIPGLGAARAVGQAVRTGATAAQVAAAARSTAVVTGTVGRQVARATVRGVGSGAVGGGVHETTRQLASGEARSVRDLNVRDIAVATGIGAGTGGVGGALGASGRAAVRAIRPPRMAPRLQPHSPPQGFSGVYDEATGSINLRPSTSQRVPQSEVPPGWVNRAGGHGEVSTQLGGNVGDHHGFAITLQSPTTVRVESWSSGTLNSVRDPVTRQVPAATRPHIVRAIEEQTGRTVVP